VQLFDVNINVYKNQRSFPKISTLGGRGKYLRIACGGGGRGSDSEVKEFFFSSKTLIMAGGYGSVSTTPIITGLLLAHYGGFSRTHTHA